MLKGIHEVQTTKIKQLEALLNEAKAKVALVEKKMLEAESSAAYQVKAVTVEAIKVFKESMELYDEKAEFASNSYITRPLIIHKRVAA